MFCTSVIETRRNPGRSGLHQTLDLTGSFCTKRFDRSWLGKKLGYAEEETAAGANARQRSPQSLVALPAIKQRVTAPIAGSRIYQA